MNILDIPEDMPLYDQLERWADSHKEEITNALKFGFSEYKDLGDSSHTTANQFGAISIIVFAVVAALKDILIGFAAASAVYFFVRLVAKEASKDCAAALFEAYQKPEILKQCFADILNKEMKTVKSDSEAKRINEFYNYAISCPRSIRFKYTK